MPTVFNGNGTMVSPTVGGWTARAIASSTNASPIAVTTTLNHGFNTGDTVEIAGHATNTAANNLWQITVSGAKTFSLNGSTGNGVGGATGYAIDYELLPAYQIPAGGELVDPGTIGPPIEGLSNLAPFLYRAGGKYRLWDVFTSGTQEPGWSAWSTTGPLTPGTLSELTNATSTHPLISSPALNQLCAVNDLLVAHFEGTFQVTDAGTPDWGSVGCAVCINNTDELTSQGPRQGILRPAAVSGSYAIGQLSVSTVFVAPSAGVPNVYLYGYCPTSAVTITLIGDWLATLSVYKRN